MKKEDCNSLDTKKKLQEGNGSVTSGKNKKERDGKQFCINVYDCVRPKRMLYLILSIFSSQMLISCGQKSINLHVQPIFWGTPNK